MQVVCDLHLHSKYSRAVSPQMVLPEMARWAKLKGIDVLGTGDFTHPIWRREIKELLEEDNGLYKLKNNDPPAGGQDNIRFLLTTEISSIYSQGGKTRRIHNLVFVPSFSSAEKISAELVKRGCNLASDGRPIIGINSRDLCEIVLTVDPDSLFIPAHVWTPWFSLYGSKSGFDSMEECFSDMSKYIYAVETGLSSDPAMNWRIPDLDNRSILSFSDAHSGAKLGREATILQVQSAKCKVQSDSLKFKISYKDIKDAIKQDADGLYKIGYTVEFYPEEGKYHFTGHRNCHVRQSPEETKKMGTTCHVCGKMLTIGVMHRVSELAGKRLEVKSKKLRINGEGIEKVVDERKRRVPYVQLVPLQEILAEAIGSPAASKKVQAEYEKLVFQLGSEFNVLLFEDISNIEKVSGERAAEGVKKVRSGDIFVDPGYDGEFGKVKIWGEERKGREEAEGKEGEKERSQLTLDF